MVSCGISNCFQLLSPCTGQIAHALLTRPPLKHFGASSSMSPLDLHVLGTPPAFVLSQDQTLMFNPSQSSVRFRLPRTVVSLRNLTVHRSLSLRLSPSRSSRTLCSCLSLFTISFSRIAVVVALALTTWIIIYELTRFVNNFYQLSFILLYIP